MVKEVTNKKNNFILIALVAFIVVGVMGTLNTVGYLTDTQGVLRNIFTPGATRFTLKYDANGGTGAPADEEATDTYLTGSHTFDISDGSGMTGPDEYKVFLGWADDPKANEPEYSADGKYAYKGTDYDGDNTVDISDNITLTSPTREKTLYAVWATKYKLSFNANAAIGGKGNVPKTQTWVTRDHEHEFNIPDAIESGPDQNVPAREKEGYYWGWWGDENVFYEINPHQYGEPITLSESAPQKELFAYYKPPKAMSLTFNGNGSGVSGVPTTFAASLLNYEWYVEIPDTIPTRSDYVFLGWSIDKNAKTGEYQPGDKFIINKIYDNAPVLYAIWQRKHAYSISFNLNNGSRVYFINPSNNNWTYTSGTKTYTSERNTALSHTWDKSFWSANGVYAERNSDQTGAYEFLGWAYKSDAKDPDIKVDDNNCIPTDITIKETNDGGESMCSSGTTHSLNLYAVWKKIPLHTYKIIFTKNPSVSDEKIINKVNGSTLNESQSGKVVSVKKDSNNNEISVNSPSGAIYASETKPTSESLYYERTAADWLSDGRIPSATKSNTNTEKYEFIGWSYEPDSSKADIQIDSDGRITGDIRVDEPNADPGDCEGTVHCLLLFPVFKKIPQHTYNLYFVTNMKSISGISQNIHFINPSNNKWTTGTTSTAVKVTDVNGNVHDLKTSETGYYKVYTSGPQDTTLTSWDRDSTFWASNGLYASCKDTKVPPTQEFKFKGWAYKKDATVPDFPVAVPADPNNPTGTEGLITGTIPVREPASGSGNECDSGADSGKVHNVVLYGVWEYEPLHQYSIIFSGNGKDSQVRYKNTNGSWTYSSGSTLKNITDYEGTLIPQIEQAYRIYSPALKVSDATTKSYTWDKNMWQSIGVYATRNSTKTTRYEFLGWSFTQGKTTPDITVDGNGCITSDITITDKNYPCEMETHTDVLYAVWKEVPIHTFKLTFNTNGGNYFRYYDNGTWKNTSSYSLTNEGGVVDVDPAQTGYTWNKAFWSTRGIGATRNNSSYYSYEFKGWAYDKNATTPDIYLDSAGSDGFINSDISINCEDDPCTGGSHELTLYAVWEPKPLTRTYTLNFDGNSTDATGVPGALVGEELYNGSAWGSYYTFTIPTVIPENREKVFVGWSTDKNATFGTYGYKNTINSEIELLTSELQPTYDLMWSNNEKPLYAIWWYEYRMTYYANGGSGAPSLEHEYTNKDVHIYKINETILPTREGYKFLGWSKDQNATTPEYSPFDDDGYPKSFPITAEESGCTKINLYAVWKKL